MTRPNCPATSPRRRSRRGFTLIEILVVVVIIGILAALLVPAISAAVNTARNAQVTAEITILEQSLASFNSKNGFYPPSRIMVNEALALDQYPLGSTAAVSSLTWLDGYSNYASPADITVGQLAQRTLNALRKMFPKVYGGAPTPPTVAVPSHFHNFNGSFDPVTGIPIMENGWYMIEGHECLALFLGGVPQPTTGGFAMTGFSKDPLYPFQSDLTGTGNRTSAFFEFKAERLVDDDGDGIPGYLDPRNGGTDARFYAYFSAYGSNGYDPNDMNFPGGRPYASGDEIHARYIKTNALSSNVWSVGPNPYTSSDPVPTNNRPVAYQKKETFQILSAGVDGVYGPGGQYIPDANEGKLPFDLNPNFPTITGIPASNPALPEARRSERDNLTNFATNKLD